MPNISHETLAHHASFWLDALIEDRLIAFYRDQTCIFGVGWSDAGASNDMPFLFTASYSHVIESTPNAPTVRFSHVWADQSIDANAVLDFLTKELTLHERKNQLQASHNYLFSKLAP